MAFRKKMSRTASRRSFRKGRRMHKKNSFTKRGGIRL